MHKVVPAAAVLLALPVLLPVAVAGLVAIRLQEQADVADRQLPDPEHVRAVEEYEDHGVQNPFTAVGIVKPGRFRRLTMRVVLFCSTTPAGTSSTAATSRASRTIHFARWVLLDGRRRMFFASNYDGSLESYMDDFIDKVAWGLNLVFSNGVGYPRTRWLVFGGARDELAFKDYLRTPPGADAGLVLGLRPS